MTLHPAVAARDRLRRAIQPQMATQFLEAVAALRKVDRPMLHAALAARQPELALSALNWDGFRAALDRGLHRAVLFGVDLAGRRAAGRTVRKADAPALGIAFDVSNPAAVRAAATRTAWLVQGIDVRTRQAIADVIRRGQLGQLSVIQQARQIEGLIGLDVRAANALVNRELYLRGLGRSEEDVTRLIQRDYDRRLRYRATTIARTESARAATIGQNEAWQQAADEGLLDQRAALRYLVPGPQPCPLCADLAWQRVALGEPFGPDLNGDEHDGPPIHPACRCAQALDTGIRSAERVATMAA